MKTLNLLVALLLVLIAGGYALYFGSNLIADEAADQVTAKLESNGQLENVKSYIENDPVLAGYMEEAKAANESDLPFTAKGDAARLLARKVGVSKLQEIQSGVQNGTMPLEDAVKQLDAKLSDDELLALKVIAYKEIYKE